MSFSEGNPNTIPEHERTEPTAEARGVIHAFQMAKTAADPTSQQQWMYQFYQRLVQLCGSRVTPANTIEMQHMLSDLTRKPRVELSVGSGTAGCRIRIEAREPLDEEQVSADGLPRWLYYPRPRDEDWLYSEQYWTRFEQAFGSEVVDLAAPLPESNRAREH
jgi:hypothetical protein